MMLSNMSTSALKVLSFYSVLKRIYLFEFYWKNIYKKNLNYSISFKLDYLFKWHVNSIFLLVLQQETFGTSY